MDEATKKALEGGEVFSKEYVHQLREETKSNREKADALNTSVEALNVTVKGLKTNNATALEMQQKQFAKDKTINDISTSLKGAGINVDANSVYIEGKTAEDAIKDFAGKNPSLFEQTKLKIGGVAFDKTEVAAMDGKMKEIKADPTARGAITKLYRTLLAKTQ